MSYLLKKTPLKYYTFFLLYFYKVKILDNLIFFLEVHFLQ